MKTRKIKFIAAGLVLFFLTATVAFAQTTTFTYQGKLTDTGNPPTAVYQMEFSLFDAVAGGTQIGATIPNNSVSVAQGIFTVNLDFLAAAFTGADRFLQIAVRRNSGESFVTLNPRQQITSSPYSIRTLSAAQADVALDSNKLGGVDASEYVTTATVGNSFIRNDTGQQTADFNVSGNGIVGGSFGVGGTPQAGINLDITGNSVFRTANGNISLGTPNSETGMTITGTNRADFRFNGSTLKLVAGLGVGPPADTNGISVNTAGNVGIGTTAPNGKLEVFGNWDGQYGALTLRGDRPTIRFSGGAATGNQQWLLHQSTLNAGSLQFFNGGTTGNFGDPKMSLSPNGNVGIGTSTPNTRLTLNGGTPWTSAGWTASMNLQNVSALGWEANASGQRFGIGQTNGGLYFFRSTSAFGTTGNPAIYDLQITDTGNITQARDKGGLVKAMIYVNANGTINRCYNGITNSSTGNCGFSIIKNDNGDYTVIFGFPINDRFFSAIAVTAGAIMSVNDTVAGANAVRVFSVDTADASRDTQFYLLVY